MRVRTPVEIPWNAKKGTQFVFYHDNERVGEMHVTGAHIYVRERNKQKWRRYSFRRFIERLTTAK
jgi:hypothetical protein